MSGSPFRFGKHPPNIDDAENLPVRQRVYGPSLRQQTTQEKPCAIFSITSIFPRVPSSR